MKFSKIIIGLTIGVTTTLAALEARATNLPTLNANQSKYARAIVKRAKDDSVGIQGCKAAIATSLVEVGGFP